MCVSDSNSTNNTRQQILDAALRLFASRGYSATSTRVIAKAAHVTKPVLYYHFHNKAGLFLAIVDRTEDQLLELVLKIKSGTPNIRDQLEQICAATFEFACDQPQAMSLAIDLWLEAKQKGPPCRHCLGKARHRLVLIQKIMEQGRYEGVLQRHFDGYQLAVAFMGMVHFHVLLRLANPSSSLNRSAAKEAVSLFLEGANSGRPKHFIPGKNHRENL